MSCAKECACPKIECPNHKRCCDCVKRHSENGNLPYCLFQGHDGDRSMESYYKMLKERFEE